MNTTISSSATRHWQRVAAIVLGVVVAAGASQAAAADELAKRASWSQPEPEAVKAQLDEWLATQDVDEPTRAQIEQVWLSGDQPWKTAGR